MKRFIYFFLLTSILGTGLFAQKPRVFLMNADTLASVQSAVFAGDKRYIPARKKLLRDADKAIKLKPVSVVEKSMLPPSGDTHDYFSLSRYWWPDPASPDGLPYIRKDGVTNPEVEKIPDHKNFGTMIRTVNTLSLAYFFSGDEKYAAAASEWLKTWFLDPETKMNPHLRFAQQVRGRDIERGTGILDARDLSTLVDAIGMLRISRSWSRSDDEQIVSWFKEYLRWLVESPNGQQESNARNNHGSWYDVQTVSIALFVGDRERARSICEEAKAKRIAYQFTPEGKQPEELARTLSWHYSQFNLLALTKLATLAQHVKVDLWNYSTEDGRNIRSGLEYMVPFLNNTKNWRETQLKDFEYDALSLVAREAALVYKEVKYARIFDRYYSKELETDRFILQHGILVMK